MLKELRIKNLAIIDDLTVRFDIGLNILSGETGAGKSIIVDALGLALGDRAQSDLIKSGAKEASVQAYFELDDYSFLPDIGIDMSEGVFLRRVLTSGGKSRAYMNDTMVTLQTLSESSRLLVDIHSQHEHQSLLTVDKQRMILDTYGKHQTALEKVEKLSKDFQTVKQEFTELQEKVKERAHRTDLLRFQVNEIQTASLQAGEKETLEEEKTLLVNQTKLKELIVSSYALLYESEGACTEKLSQVLGQLREMHAIDSGVEEILEMIESAKPLLEDAAFELRNFRDRYDFEPGRLVIVEDRLELIKKLEKKYGEGIQEVLTYKEKAEEELQGLENSDERLASLEEELVSKETALLEAAKDLSDRRRRTAKNIEGLIKDILKELAIGKADFSIDIVQETGDDGKHRISSHGMDRIEFLFSANPGEPLKPLTRIVSGGELSRVMLALKSILADVDKVPVLIFDEVDAGIGGKTAESVGKKLDTIADRHQLLCITHLPQIARFGDFHLKVEKKEKNKKVSVEIKELTGKERRDEIARMLSGKITDISLKHAGELLERVR
jgi:DNA repair protein RecN (Recombination protein N)